MDKENLMPQSSRTGLSPYKQAPFGDPEPLSKNATLRRKKLMDEWRSERASVKLPAAGPSSGIPPTKPVFAARLPTNLERDSTRRRSGDLGGLKLNAASSLRDVHGGVGTGGGSRKGSSGRDAEEPQTARDTTGTGKAKQPASPPKTSRVADSIPAHRARRAQQTVGSHRASAENFTAGLSGAAAAAAATGDSNPRRHSLGMKEGAAKQAAAAPGQSTRLSGGIGSIPPASTTAAGARVSSFNFGGAGAGAGGLGSRLGLGAAGISLDDSDDDPLTDRTGRQAAAAAAGGKNDELKVEKRFQYWKQFWKNIQTLRQKFAETGEPLPENLAAYKDEMAAEGISMPPGAGPASPPRERAKPAAAAPAPAAAAPAPAAEQAPPAEEPRQRSARKQSKAPAAAEPEPAPAAAAAAAAPAADPAGGDGKSNIERFWEEELKRKVKPRSVHPKKKKAAQFASPAHPDQARKLWQQMAKDLDSKLASRGFKQAAEDIAAAAAAADEDSPAEGTAQQQQQQQQQPEAAAPVFETAGSKPGEPAAEADTAGGRFGYRPYRHDPSEYPSTRGSKEYVASAPAQPAEAPKPTRSHSTKGSSHGHGAGAGAGAGTAGAAAADMAPGPDLLNRRAQHGKSAYPSAGGAGAAAEPMSAEDARLHKLSVKELKRELGKFGVATDALVLEKKDLIARIKECTAKREAKAKAEREEKEKERMRERIVSEVERWAKGKNVKEMLNEINGLKSPDKAYLRRSATMTPVNKAYKKALLKIHPDKHMTDYARHVRATEMFKYLNESFNEFRKRMTK